MEKRGEGYLVPYMAVPPGAILDAELEERQIPIDEFALAIDVTPRFLREFIIGERPVTQELAKKISKALKVPTQFWLNLQNNYEYDLQAIAERDRNHIFQENYADQHAVLELN